ncbi:MAG TPA: STAS domain-containing protein [Candidatus Acidoferrales bacterium]|nr:STAS domain-containing protein [Candidatus Acidoferrales bacterium]
METAVGVFGSRENAELAMKELLNKRVPQESLVFLTRSETDARSLGKEIGTYAGGFVGGSVGMAAGTAAVALALVPGIGQVFALGVGATALLGYLGARSGQALGGVVAHDSAAPQPTPETHVPEDAALFVEVLKQGHSLIVVRTEFHDVARAACEVLDRMGLGRPGAAAAPAGTRSDVRHVGGVAVVDLAGAITVGKGNLHLREVVDGLLSKGSQFVVLNMAQVDYLDSSGIGELARSLASVRKSGGHLKLASVSKRVYELLQTTHLHKVFDIQADEAAAIQSFGASAGGAAAKR